METPVLTVRAWGFLSLEPNGQPASRTEPNWCIWMNGFLKSRKDRFVSPLGKGGFPQGGPRERRGSQVPKIPGANVSGWLDTTATGPIEDPVRCQISPLTIDNIKSPQDQPITYALDYGYDVYSHTHCSM